MDSINPTIETKDEPEVHIDKVDGSSTDVSSTDVNTSSIKNKDLPINVKDDVTKDDPRYKTVLCKFFEEGKCADGDKCTFAHGFEDIRPRKSFTNSDFPQLSIAKMRPKPTYRPASSSFFYHPEKCTDGICPDFDVGCISKQCEYKHHLTPKHIKRTAHSSTVSNESVDHGKNDKHVNIVSGKLQPETTRDIVELLLKLDDKITITIC